LKHVNKCSQLFNSELGLNYDTQIIYSMFKLQRDLQNKLGASGRGLDYDKSTFIDKVNQIALEWKNINLEMAELVERLPHKSWKSYTDVQKTGWENEEQKLETWYEYIDVFHFFLNVGLLLGIGADDFVKLYLTKNAENFDRQKRGY